MLIKRAPDIRPSEITPKEIYFNRRKFMTGVGAAGAAFLAGRFVGEALQPRLSAQAATKLQYVQSNLSAQDEQLTPLNSGDIMLICFF